MKKALTLMLLLLLAFDVYSNDLLNELIEKLNNNNIYLINEKSKKSIEENKLYLIPELNTGGFSIEFHKGKLEVVIGKNPLAYEFDDYNIIKKVNNYIIEGTTLSYSGRINLKMEFIFNKNILNFILTEGSKILYNYFYYIDLNNDLEERYNTQRKSYLYNLVKDSKNNELELTQDNKLIYERVMYNYKINPLLTADGGDFYKDKFVLTFGEYEMPVEIINNTLKIIKDRKLIEKAGAYDFYSLEEVKKK